MIKQIYKNNLIVSYKDEGIENEKVIVLIHGFLETSETWSDFSKELAKNHRVISLDLPGHGNSSIYSPPYSMCKNADSIIDILEHEKIEKAFIVGHSMGGYVAMAFAQNYPEKMSGFCLFHSTPFADNDVKIKSRNEAIRRIENGEKDDICKTHSKAVFAEDNLNLFKNEIKRGEQIAKEISKKSAIASVLTMKSRLDRTEVLEKIKVPFLYILGKKDKFIPYEIYKTMCLPENCNVSILENSGHMGFIEEKEKSLKIINDFIKNKL